MIVDLRRPVPWPIEERRQALIALLGRLHEHCSEHFGTLVELSGDHPDPQNGIRLVGLRHGFPANEKLSVVHRQGGFLEIPDAMSIRLCNDEGVAQTHAEDYRRRAEEAFAGCGVNDVAIGFSTLEKLQARLDELDRGDSPKRRDVPVLFMLADKDTPPSHRLRHVMRRMERYLLPWRRAHADDPRKWSVSDQVGSLLQAAGGHSHSVVLDDGKCLPWSIGIDLSKRRSDSRVAACLLSPEGRLAGSWVLDQRQQENIEPRVLRRLIEAAAGAIPASDRSSGILVIRDGRVFESEKVADYRRDLGGPVTLVEIRKGRNPPLLLGSEARLPENPIVAWRSQARNGSLGFLAPLHDPKKDEFGRVLKIWMKDAWDGMGLGPQRLAHILLAQTLAPGLGMRARSLPAPTYWADGIAGASDKDLRFRGQQVVDLN